MASLYLRKGVWYINYRVNGRRSRMSTGTSDKRLAQVKFDDLKVKLFKGEIGVSPAKITSVAIPDFFRRYREYRSGSSTSKHIGGDFSRLKILQDFFARKGIKHLHSITPSVIAEFQTTVLDSHKPQTKKAYLTLLKTVLNYAVQWDLIEVNPIAKVKAPKITKTFHFFSQQEIQNLIREAEEPLKSAIMLLVNTGIRRGELFALRWRDVDLKERRLRVWPYEGFSPKGKKPRSIPLNDQAIEAFENLERQTGESEFVFRDLMVEKTLYDMLSRLLKGLGMKGTVHGLRHTFASHLAIAGVSIPIIKELLGHSNIATTMIYAHLSPEIYAPAVEKLKFDV